MGAMYLLHASLTEYVLLFGTGVDTSGHSGEAVCVWCVCVCGACGVCVYVCTYKTDYIIIHTINAGLTQQWIS